MAAVPGLRRATLSRPRSLGGDAPYLVAELWFDDEAALRTALASPEMAATGRDADTLRQQYAVPRILMFTGAVADVGLPG